MAPFCHQSVTAKGVFARRREKMDMLLMFDKLLYSTVSYSTVP